jgi:4-amino-4-deoxy-L-arabinose transferase-like glycosyltransferase
MQHRLTKLVCFGGFAAWIAGGVVRWITNAPLLHDEAQYALDARDLLHGEASRWIYTSPGMQWLAVPGVATGGDERVLRLVPLLFGIAFLLSAWYLARRLFSAETAAWTVAVLGSAPQMVRFSASLLSDLPTTACMLTALAIIFGELSRDEGPRRRLLVAGPLLAAAFYLRYGSCIPIAIIGVATLAFNARAIIRYPRIPLLTAAALVVLLVPHAITSMRQTGSPLGVILFSAGVPRPGDGVVGYLENPLASYGALVAPLMVIGALFIQRNRISTAVQLMALAQIIALGVLTHAQPRYIFFGTVLLVIRAVDVLRGLAPRLGRLRRHAELAALAIVTALALYTVFKAVWFRSILRDRLSPLLLACSTIRDDAKGADCEVFGRHLTQMEWYTGCLGVLEATPESMTSGKRIYGVWVNTGLLQPDLDSMPGTYVLQVPRVVAVRRLSP